MYIGLSSNEKLLLKEYTGTIKNQLSNSNNIETEFNIAMKLCESLIECTKTETNRTFGGSFAHSHQIGLVPITSEFFDKGNWVEKNLHDGWNKLSWREYTNNYTWMGIWGFEDLRQASEIQSIRMKIGVEQLSPDSSIQDFFHPKGSYRYILPLPIRILPNSCFNVEIKVQDVDFVTIKPLGYIAGLQSEITKILNKSYSSAKIPKAMDYAIQIPPTIDYATQIPPKQVIKNYAYREQTEPPAKPICGSCGSINDKGSKFCYQCGNPIKFT